MEAATTGLAPPHNRKGRAVLSVRDPFVETLLGGLGISEDNLAETRQFCKWLVRSRNQWDISRRRGGLFGSRRLSRDEASRAFAETFGKAGLRNSQLERIGQ